MNLAEYYENLPHTFSPKAAFVKELTNALGVTETAVRNWLKGRAKPADPEHVDYISKVTGITAEELFPARQ